MSWSITIIGKPENVVAELDAHSQTLSGESKKEYDEALPHMKAIVGMNVSNQYPALIKVEASGHAYRSSDMHHSSCNLSIAQVVGKVV